MTSTETKNKPKIEVQKKITRQYIVSQKQLKDAFGIEGNIVQIDFWSGLSPKQDKEGVSKDKNTFFIKTEEGKITGEED